MIILQALHKVLSPIVPEDVKQTARNNWFNPSPLQQMLFGQENETRLAPLFTDEALMTLKHSLRATLQGEGLLPSCAYGSDVVSILEYPC